MAATVVALVTIALAITDRANTRLETLAKAMVAVVVMAATKAQADTARTTEAVVVVLVWATSLTLRLSRMPSTRANLTCKNNPFLFSTRMTT